MSDKLKAIVVDDEPFAVKGLVNYINEVKFIELVGTFENAMDAGEALGKQQVDLMFLDIQMPELTGIDFLKSLKTKPLTVFTSAYPEYALEGYELDVIDYLVKPISAERFLKACQKAKEYYELQLSKKSTTNSEDSFFIKCDKKIEKVLYDDILYVEALHNYVAVYTHSNRLVTYLTLKNIEERLPKDRFIKVQKSFIVSFSKVKGIEDGNVIVESQKKIPISRTNREEITKAILGNNLLKR